jgi:hypothetical protein
MSASQAEHGAIVWADESGPQPEVDIDEQPPEPPPPTPTPAALAAPRVQRGSARGLTGPGVALVLLAASVVGAVIDTTVGDDLGPFFAVLFVASSLYAATQVRRADLFAAVIAPPLVFLLVVGVHEVLAPTGNSRALIDLVGDLVSALALGAPTLWAGTAVAAAVVLLRRRYRR